MSELLTKPTLNDTDIGSPDDKKHLALKEDIARAAVEGGKIKALCGVEFEPIRDPERFPLCESCEKIYGLIFNSGGN